MRTEIVFKSRRKSLVGEIISHTETYYDIRHVDRDGKFRCTRVERAEVREVRNLLIDLPAAVDPRRA